MDNNDHHEQDDHQRTTNQQRQRRKRRCRRHRRRLRRRNQRLRNVQLTQTAAAGSGNKRKRNGCSLEQEAPSSVRTTTMPKSISSISILQSSQKKLKRKGRATGTVSGRRRGHRHSTNTNYRFVMNFGLKIVRYISSSLRRCPLYLKRKLSVLFYTLNQKLANSLEEHMQPSSKTKGKKKKKSKGVIKKRSERRFIYERLRLLDQKRCLQLDQQLWQSYLDFGSEKHIWPVNLFDPSSGLIVLSIFFVSLLKRFSCIVKQRHMIHSYVGNICSTTWKRSKID